MKLYALFIIIAILCSATLTRAEAQNLPPPQATQVSEKLLEFNAISVRGPIRLTIEQVKENEPNYIKFSSGQRSPVSTTIKDGTLYLQADDSQQTTEITAGLHQLNQLMADEGSSVVSKQLTSASLSIDANTSGSIELFGMVTLDRILTSGKGAIRIQWVDTPRLRIDGSDNSAIHLAGVAGAVEMRLRDESHFYGQYLRIDRIFVQTKNYAVAKLSVNDSLKAFAYDHSNIYYYKRPAELTEFTSDSGNVLQVNWGP